MKQSTEEDMLSAYQKGIRYDAECKKVFSNKEIIAPILGKLVSELEGCSQEEIVSLIESNGDDGIPVADVSPNIQGLPTEYAAIHEKLIRYDLFFKVKNPKLSEGNILVYLYIDFEVQNNYHPKNPPYEIVTRGMYYAARALSQQLGNLNEQTGYGSLQKVYSIWICNENVPADIQNTVSHYRMEKTDVYGDVLEDRSLYDLMKVIIVRRGSKLTEEALFDYLSGIFTGNLQTMNKYVTMIPEEVERQVSQVTGMGESIYLRGRDEGFTEGRAEGHAEGRTEGINLLSYLIQKLLADGRNADISKATSDEKFREELFKQYGI